jgi:hypothetical protein
MKSFLLLVFNRFARKLEFIFAKAKARTKDWSLEANTPSERYSVITTYTKLFL